jgi:nucleotide-binding universal stress UspA family protein
MNWLIGTIVVPSDGSPGVDAQLTTARALARMTGAKIVVVHVNEVVRGRMATHPIHADEDEVQAALRQQVDELRALGLRAELEIRTSASGLAATLASVAERRHADLVILRRGRTHHVLAGSVSRLVDRISRSARCPVLITG